LTYYAKIVVSLLIVAAGYGFAVPFLVSAENNLVVLAGFGIAFLTPVIIYSMWSTDIANAIKAITAPEEVPVAANTKATKSKRTSSV
jgi:hypothetical protein